MASDRKATAVHFTTTLPFPIKIINLLVPEQSTVERGTSILYYNYDTRGVDGDEKLEQRVGVWESPVKGKIKAWEVKVGAVVKNAEKPVVSIEEPCRHEEQVNGMCLICYEDVTNIDYTGFSDAARATVAMVHDAAGITVSQEVAERLEAENFKRLLAARKLSLVVDLDQTIVHATVDPTVGEWIAEGEAWEAGKEGAKHNPNWEALKDVKRFRLADERRPLPRGVPQKGKRRDEGCWYYIKLRPGLHAFLERLSEIYEMHVYTMGTRSYATEVVKAIDPTGAFFGSRVLSRDESGSATFKNLMRLFPCNSNMAVIIDDRADVWDFSKGNLVKVIPYDFFVGIGDINSAFLPQQRNNILPAHAMGLAHSHRVPTLSIASPSPSPSASSDATAVSPDLVPKVVLADDEPPDEAEEKAALEMRQSVLLEAQRESRPLQRKQAELEAAVEKEMKEREKEADGDGEVDGEDGKSERSESRSERAEPVERALLTNNDHELERIQKILEEVHRRYYKAQDAAKDKGPVPSIMGIIPRMKEEVLDGVHLVFSSLIPVDMPPMNTEIWKQALQFGASCHVKMDKEVTHVIAAKRGTDKVRVALTRPGIKIVNPMWFVDSIARWQRQNEEDYILEGLEDRPPPDDGLVTHPNSTPSTTQKELSPRPTAETNEEEEVEVDMEDVDGRELDLGDVDWGAADAELDEMMGEDSESEGGSEYGGDDEDVDSVRSRGSSSRARGKKRARNDSAAPTPGASDDEGSPLAKRKKIALDRQGASRLKVEVIPPDEPAPEMDTRTRPDAEETDEDDSSFDDDDDFLGAALANDP